MSDVCVQFGCGLCAPPTWRNFDASLTVRIETGLSPLKPLLVRSGFADFPANVEYGDILKSLPVAPGTVKSFYCSHVLEHLSLEECRTAIRNVFNYLEPGGCFRMVLPDLEYMITEYTRAGDPRAAVNFIEATGMGVTGQTRGFGKWIREGLGRSQHRWLWDYKALAAELADAGFVGIRRATWGDAADPCFLDVEDVERWGNNLGLECMRPLSGKSPTPSATS